MILDALAIPNLSYEILEGSGRVGGRVYTYKFSDVKHDYYDVSDASMRDGTISDRCCQGRGNALSRYSNYGQVMAPLHSSNDRRTSVC